MWEISLRFFFLVFHGENVCSLIVKIPFRKIPTLFFVYLQRFHFPSSYFLCLAHHGRFLGLRSHFVRAPFLRKGVGVGGRAPSGRKASRRLFANGRPRSSSVGARRRRRLG